MYGTVTSQVHRLCQACSQDFRKSPNSHNTPLYKKQNGLSFCNISLPFCFTLKNTHCNCNVSVISLNKSFLLVLTCRHIGGKQDCGERWSMIGHFRGKGKQNDTLFVNTVYLLGTVLGRTTTVLYSSAGE